MAGKIEVSRELVQEAANQPAVVAQLGAVARRVKSRADSLASAEGVDMNTWVVEGKRPGWRPQAVVYGDNVGQEFGSSREDRRRIMGRAAEGG